MLSPAPQARLISANFRNTILADFRIAESIVYLRNSRMINWNEIRKQFPVTETVAYLNSAAAGPVSRAARDAALGYYEKMMRDGDVHWNQWLAQRETIRTKIARFINAKPDEIGLTTNTSSGMNVIVDALEDRGEVISSILEF